MKKDTVTRLLVVLMIYFMVACQSEPVDSFADKIIYRTKDYDTHIALMDTDGSNKQVITHGDYTSFSYIDLSPDGKQVMVNSYKHRQPAETYLISCKTMELVPFTIGDIKNKSARFSPDGTWIVAIEKDGDDFDIYTYEINTGEKSQLTANDEMECFPRYSPDGTRIAFTRQIGETAKPFVMNTDGSNQKILGNLGNNDYAFFPEFSPDGKKVLFEVNRVDSLFYVLLMDIDGSNIIEISADENYGQANFSPNGSKIVFLPVS